MAIRTVTVKIRIKTPEGKRVYAVPMWETKGRLRAFYARINGKPELQSEVAYKETDQRFHAAQRHFGTHSVSRTLPKVLLRILGHLNGSGPLFLSRGKWKVVSSFATSPSKVCFPSRDSASAE
jgi:hypothetical protein